MLDSVCLTRRSDRVRRTPAVLTFYFTIDYPLHTGCYVPHWGT